MRNLLVMVALVVSVAACGVKRDMGNAEVTRAQVTAQLGIEVRHVVIKVVKADVASKESRTLVFTVPRELTAEERSKVEGIVLDAFEKPVDRIEYEVCSPSAECPKPDGY